MCLRAVSAVMSLAFTVSAIPVQAYAEEIIPEDVYIQEIGMTEEILSSDVFYLTAANAQLSEGANERYYLRIGRGGDSLSAASVNVKIADLTAKYGEDYEIYLLNGDTEVENPEDNQSFVEMMEGEECIVTPIIEEDEFNEMTEEDAQLQQSAVKAINDSITYIEESAGLTPAEPADGSEKVSTDPLQQARADYTGIDGEAQNVTASQDTFAQIQKIADVLTTAVVGASLKVDFAEGEDSRYIVIDVDNNMKSDGDRYFYLMLSEPSGTTTVSASSSCAVTIVDDEEQELSEVSFGECSFNESYDTLTVEIKRNGAINSLTDVQLQTEGITAQTGRDFSPVDMSVIFPMGIDTRTIDIPVCRDYLTGDAEFKLKLTNNVGANVLTAEKNIVLSAAATFEEPLLPELDEGGYTNTVSGSPVYLGAENKRYLGNIEVTNTINLKNPVKKDADNEYTGFNGSAGDGWKLRWQGGNSWTRFWHNHKGTVAAQWQMSGYSGFHYAGAQIEWSMSWDGKNPCASASVGFESSNTTAARDLQYGAVYCSDAALDNTVTNVFSNISDPVYISIANTGNCDDCQELYIKSVRAIKRPFEIKLAEADKLKFLQADGSMKSDDGTATYLAIIGAENNDPTQSTIYYCDETITFSQVIGKNISRPYTYLKELNSTDGFEFARFENEGKITYSKVLSKEFINENSSWDNSKMFKYYDNTYMKNSNPSSGCEYGKYGSVELKPVFDYINSEVTVVVPEDNFGYLNISGTDKNIQTTTTYNYHRGDTLLLSTKMNKEYADIYEPVGVKIRYKVNKDDSNWEEDKIVIYDENGEAYLDSSHKLEYGYYEVTPLFQAKGNVITVRVAQSELNNFDTSYGLFSTKAVRSVTISDKKYNEYIVYNNAKYGNIYSLSVRSLKNNVYPVWKAVGETNQYSGEVFYYEAKNNKEQNVIELSTETVKNTYDYYHTISGKILSRVYNMQTGGLDETTMIPHQGAIAAAGGSFAVAGDDGSFTVDGIRAVPGRSIRYIVTVNGVNLLKEKKLGSGDKAVEQTIILPDTSSIKADVISNEVGNLFINTENGSILNEIEVWVDDMNNAGYNISVDPEKSITVNAQCNAPVSYMTLEEDEEGNVREVEKKENLTGAVFVIYSDKNEIMYEYRAEYNEEKSTFSANIPMKDIQPGYGLYLRTETDKIMSGMPGEIMVYSDAYTGYLFTQSTAGQTPPIMATVTPLSNVDFIELPLIGDISFNFSFPFASVSVERTDTGYHMSFGVNPIFIADKIKGSNLSRYSDITGIKKMWSLKNPFSSYVAGIKEAWKFIGDLGTVAEQSMCAAKQMAGALGAPTWKFNLEIGATFDFTYAELTNPVTGLKYKEAVFTGVGGYIGVSGGFKMSWYTIIPVIFMPAYFGVEIDAEILGYFGAGTDTSKPVITYDEASKGTVSYDDVLGEYEMLVCMTGGVQIYAGVGLDRILGMRGGGRVEIMGQYEPSEELSDIGCNITFTAGIWVDLLLFTLPLEYDFPSIKFGSFAEVANNNLESEPDIDENSDFLLRAPYSEKESQWLPSETNSDTNVKSNRGLTNVLPDSPELKAGFSESVSYTLVSDGYEHPEVQLLKLSDGSIFMAFLDSDSSREDTERTVLKYAVYSDGKWSEPAAISDDGTADFHPSICEMDNSRVMIAWLSSDPEKKKSETVKDYLKSLEVYSAVIDYDVQNAVSEVTRLTTDEYFDYSPVAAYDEVTGDRMVYFVKTASDGTAAEMANSYTNNCVITYMLYSDPENNGEGRWLFDDYYDEEAGNEVVKSELVEEWNGQRFLASPISELGLDVPNISDFTVTTYNGYAVYAYTIDKDSSNDTSFDKEVFVQLYDFKTHKTYMPIRLSNDNVSDAMPQFVRAGSGEEAYISLFWYRNEKEIAYVDITDLIRNGVDENGQILDEYMNRDGVASLERIYSYVQTGSDENSSYRHMSDFKPVVDGKNIYIVWTQMAEGQNSDDFCSEVFAAALINPDTEDENGEKIGCAWSDPYRLTYSYECTDEPAVAIDTNGNMMVVYNQYNQELTGDSENPVNISDFRLRASYMEPSGSVDVENITVSDYTPVEGETVSITFEAVNSGLTYSEGYTVEVYAEKDGKSELIDTIDIDDIKLPGERDIYTVEWTVPDNIAGYVIKTETYEKGGSWTNHSYAESEEFIERAEYSVENVNVCQDGNDFIISYDVINTGNAESTNDDKYNVTLVGPYFDTFGCTDEECIFAEVPLGGIAAGKTESFTQKLNIPFKVFEKYGYVNCFAAAIDKDGNHLIPGEEVRIGVTQPLNLKLNGEDYPTEIIMSVGETMNLEVSCSPAQTGDGLETVFGSENSDVAVVNGTTITACEAGTTIIRGSVSTFGEIIPDITVTVIDGGDFCVREVDEGFVITKYLGVNADRIEVPSEIGGRKVVGVDDFAFGSVTDDAVIAVPETLMSKYIGSEAFMTYAVVNEQIIKMSEGTTVNEVLRYWFNEVGEMNYTDEQINEAVVKVLSYIGNTSALSMPELVIEVLKNADNLDFPPEKIGLLKLVLSVMNYDNVKLEGPADTDAQAYAKGKMNLEYIVAAKGLKGDVTLDGAVNLYDVIAIAQYVMDSAKYPLSDEAMPNGDVAENGKIDIYDAIEIAKAIMAG